MFLFVLCIALPTAVYANVVQPTQVTFQVFLEGIGKAGDFKNPQSSGNGNPVHKEREISVQIYSEYNKLVKSIKDSLTYDTYSGSFIGTLDIGDIPDGNYGIYVKVKNYLAKQYPEKVQILSHHINVISSITLVAGDMTEANSISIVDYNILISCFGKNALLGGCLNKQAADLNDDGIVDGVDYNLLLREMYAIGGKNYVPLPTPTMTPTPTLTPTPTPTPTPSIIPTPTALPGPQTSIENIVPLPASVTSDGGRFEITQDTSIYVTGDSEVQNIGKFLADKLAPSTGFALQVQGVATYPLNTYGNIYLTLSSDQSLGDEGYQLVITQANVTLTAYKPAGLFRGIQTIRQMLPFSIDSTSTSGGPWILATGVVRDYPRYKWRGVMLDVVRHFFSFNDVKRLIDEVSYYKMNIVHLHLTDDQGWRIQIKSRPALTYGGSYYTQDQYAQIVEYAKQRYITIVPEMDMPGHSYAARAAYPQLNCNEGDNLCVYSNETYSFVDDVVREVAALTPGNYIHIGGDESSLGNGSYTTFVDHVQDIIRSHGKFMLGWDESSRADLFSSSAVQYWINGGYASEAVRKNAKVIMSPVCHAYIDFSYSYGVPGGAGFVGSCPYLSVQSSYNWDPNSDIWGVTDQDILGVEVPLWTETVYTMSDVEYMTFPRAIAMAEVGWTSQNRRNWSDFKSRLGSLGTRLSLLGVNFYHSPDIWWR